MADGKQCRARKASVSSTTNTLLSLSLSGASADEEDSIHTITTNDSWQPPTLSQVDHIFDQFHVAPRAKPRVLTTASATCNVTRPGLGREGGVTVTGLVTDLTFVLYKEKVPFTGPLFYVSFARLLMVTPFESSWTGRPPGSSSCAASCSFVTCVCVCMLPPPARV